VLNSTASAYSTTLLLLAKVTVGARKAVVGAIIASSSCDLRSLSLNALSLDSS
jgi:hypothetical protein